MRTVAIAALLFVVALGWVYWLMAWFCVWRHFRRRPVCCGFTPGVSILKPLKGVDSGLKENLASFCRLDYPDYEILIGLRDADDPAVPIVQQLCREFPQCAIHLFFTPDLGINPKSAILNHLTQHARNPVLVISDADIRVRPDYLQCVVTPLEVPSIGLVTCPYRSGMSGRLVSAIEAMHIDLAFIPAAVLGSCLPGIRYAFGATLAMRADDLRRCGGYASIADMLGDDYAIGLRLGSLGLRTSLSHYPVDHFAGDETFPELWQREVRWARTVQTVAPLHYAGLLLPLCTLWAIGPLVISGLAAWAWGVLGATLLLRWVSAWSIAGELGNKPLRRWLIWLPFRDALDALIWVVGLMGNRITWRGFTYTVRRDGTLIAPHPVGLMDGVSLPRRLVRMLDAYLRRREKIFEYSGNPECLFRIALVRLDEPMVLQDQTQLSAGDRIIDLHFWNEHLPPIGAEGPDLAWAALADSRVNRSLRELAAYLDEHQELRDIAALRANAGFMIRTERQLQRLIHRYGFEEHGQTRARTIRQRLRRFGENFLLWSLIWAFNPGERKRKNFSRPRYMIWMSREVLCRHYGSRVGPRRRRDATEGWKELDEVNAISRSPAVEEPR